MFSLCFTLDPVLISRFLDIKWYQVGNHNLKSQIANVLLIMFLYSPIIMDTFFTLKLLLLIFDDLNIYVSTCWWGPLFKMASKKKCLQYIFLTINCSNSETERNNKCNRCYNQEGTCEYNSCSSSTISFTIWSVCEVIHSWSFSSLLIWMYPILYLGHCVALLVELIANCHFLILFQITCTIHWKGIKCNHESDSG